MHIKEHLNCFRVHFVPFGFLFFKLVGWVIEERKYAAAVGDRAFLVVVLYGKELNHWLVYYFFFSIVLYK